MNRRFTWLLVLALGAAPLTAAADYLSVGVGSTSCARWLSDDAVSQIDKGWILGFWSGMNNGGIDPFSDEVAKIIAKLPSRQSIADRSTDPDGILGEIRLVCQSSPSKSIEDATIEVWQRFATEGR